jgi:hypothetical protein
VGAAGRPREGGAGPEVAVLGPVAVAPPGYGGDLLVDVGLAFGGGVAGYGVEIGREGDLGVVDLFVVGFEGGGEDLGVGVAVYIV